MPVAALYDIHGNLPALEAVLAELDREPVDAIVCGGDILSGPYQSECVALLRERGARFLSGNSEREVLAGADELLAWWSAQFDRTIGGIRLVNAGSVGLPYEGRAGAFWALFGGRIELRNTAYDIECAAERLRASGMPGADELLPESLLAPLLRDEVAAIFERQAGREPSQSSVSISQNARPANSR